MATATSRLEAETGRESFDLISESRTMTTRRDHILLFVILVVAAASRIYKIDVPDIWVDEANLILTSGEPFGVMFDKLRVDSSPPLYYLSTRLWSALFGDSAVALRSLSVIGGVATVGALWWVARDLLSPRAGWWAAFYLAINPSHCFYSQQVRMYVWLGLLSVLSLAGLVRFLRDGKRRDFALWVIASILALYTHNFAIHLGIAHGLLIALSGQLFSRIRSWALAAAVVAVIYGPWIPSLLGQLGNEDHYAWFLPVWEETGVAGTIVNSLRSMSPNIEFMTYWGVASRENLSGVPTFGASALAALGAWVGIRRIRSAGAAIALWPVIGLAAPALSALTLSLLLTPHYVPGRVDQMMLPQFALLVGAGIALVRPPALRGVLGAAILVTALVARLQMYDEYRDPTIDGGDRAVALAITQSWQPQDVIITTSLSRGPLVYYLRNFAGDRNMDSIEARIISFPRASADHLGAQNDASLLSDKLKLTAETIATLAEARELAGSTGRLFIVWVHSRVNYLLRRGALENYGYDETAFMGRFRQFGTGLMMEVRQYRLRSRPHDLPRP